MLLALVEDDETAIRHSGLQLLASFLDRCPQSVLQDTGIGSVFEDAVFPTLLFLPTLTPEDESVRLLHTAYGVLILLARTDPDMSNLTRRRRLDRLLRSGVFTGYHHASEHVRIVEVLMMHTAAIIKALGVYTIKHLPVR